MSGGAVPTNGVEGPPATVADVTHSSAGTDNPKEPRPASNLGPLIRMRVLQPKDLPSHPDLASAQTAGEEPKLNAFLNGVLTEGHTFMTGYLPKHFKVKNSKKTSPPSTAPVELLAHTISGTDLPIEARTDGVRTTENWFARTSIHENAAKAGTASWGEFDGGLRADHSLHEKDYTPSIRDVHQVLAWPVEAQVGEWREVHASIMEMVHEIPGPLSDRVFNVLVITGKKDDEFIDVQIPVDTAAMASAKYKNDTKRQVGVYCSVELGQLIESGTKVKWQMGTASDAKGILPMWAQKMGVPGAVVKDVGLFLEWCEKRRKGQA